METVIQINNFNNDIWDASIYFSCELISSGNIRFDEIIVVKLSANDNHGVSMGITDAKQLDKFYEQYEEAIMHYVNLHIRTNRGALV